jgi:ABC-type hemin transport system ATPase subunit
MRGQFLAESERGNGPQCGKERVSEHDFVLETEGLSKSFAGLVALKGVDLKVRRGQSHVLIGPNGAGKTTCFNLLTGFLTPSSGSIFFEGIDITALSAAQVARRGPSSSIKPASSSAFQAGRERAVRLLSHEWYTGIHSRRTGQLRCYLALSLDAYRPGNIRRYVEAEYARTPEMARPAIVQG